MENISIDEAGKGVGVLPAKRVKIISLLTLLQRAIFSERIDHMLTVNQDKIVGPGVADNSLELVTLASLLLIM